MMGRRSQGFSLVAAMFIMVVLALLGVFMVTISGSQHFTAASASMGSRAYYAARSGVEWGAGQVANSNSCAATTTLALPAYAEFTVTVTCNNGGAASHLEGGNTYPVYVVQATAVPTGVALGDPRYVSRSVRLAVTTAP